MEKYKVLLYPKAFRDIDSIYAYIALEKLAPENAKSQTDRIWSAIEALDSFPSSHQDRQVGKYAGKGYKQLLIDHYVAIFKIDEPSKTGHRSVSGTEYLTQIQKIATPVSVFHSKPCAKKCRGFFHTSFTLSGDWMIRPLHPVVYFRYLILARTKVL